MRKILLGTTAVVGAALLAPGAFAQTTRAVVVRSVRAFRARPPGPLALPRPR